MTVAVCSLPECGRPRHARGWCIGHYQRWRSTGDPGGPLRAVGVPAEERFWAKVDTNGPISEHAPDGLPCWLWTGNKTKRADLDPHGRFYPGKEGVLAHRYAYELLVGPIPEGLHLDHLCRVRLCVRPSHLEPVTPEENTRRGVGPTAENARKTHCSKGHPLNEKRRCPTCIADTKRRSEARRMADPDVRARRWAKQRERYARRKATAGGR